MMGHLQRSTGSGAIKTNYMKKAGSDLRDLRHTRKELTSIGNKNINKCYLYEKLHTESKGPEENFVW